MRERPILFSAPMVCALLDGRKTQTRRVVRPQPERVTEHMQGRVRVPEGWSWKDLYVSDESPSPFAANMDHYCPYGAPGDRLWVRETWFPDPPIDGSWDGDIQWNGCGRPIGGVPEAYRSPAHCIYAATRPGVELAWRPSIHMPRWASRITLEVTDVRVERLQDLSDDDAIAEGVPPDHGPGFADLWDDLNGKRAPWSSNPWVWCVSFLRVDP